MQKKDSERIADVMMSIAFGGFGKHIMNLVAANPDKEVVLHIEVRERAIDAKDKSR